MAYGNDYWEENTFYDEERADIDPYFYSDYYRNGIGFEDDIYDSNFRRDRRGERRDIREERRDIREDGRDIREARRHIREGGRDIREARRDIREERRECRRDGGCGCGW